MSFDFSKLNNLKKNELYRDEYYYKINEEKQREQQEENNNYSKNNSIWDDVKNTFNNLMVNEKQRNNTYNRGNQSIDQQALEQNNNANFIMQMQNVNKAYRQDQEDKLKGSIAYKQAKLNNPNVSDKELLKIAQNENTKLDNGLLKDISSKNGAERIQEIKSISKSQSNPLFYDNNKFRKINNSVLQYKIAEESQEQANKINKDLKNGKISSSVEHVLEALPTKAMEAVASPIYATGSLMNLKLPTGTADQDLQDWKAISSKYDQTTGNIESGLVRSASNVSGTIGYMIPSILASAIAPETNLGRITQGVSVGGQSYIETLNDDASNKLQSALTGLGKGTASYAIEGIAGGNILGKGSLDDLAVKTIASKTSNEVSKKIASMVYEVGGEVFEEELENQVDYLVDKIVNNKGISLKEWLTEQNETVKSTIASTLVLKLLGLGGNTYKDVKEYEYNADAKKWINEAEKIIDKENLVIDTEKLKVKNNQKEVKNVLSNLDNINNNSTQNLQQNTTQNQFNSQEQQIIPVQNENVSNLDITTNNISKPTIKDFNESAKQYNIDYKNEDLKEIKQMFDKRGINAYFDENIFQSNNDAFSVWKPTYDEQGNISGREVVFNPKAQDTNTRVQELAIHELGHDLDLNEVQDMILKDASRKENWESARKSLENTYKHAYENDNIQISDENFNKIVDEEATMSILQRELGNQEYVNRLVNQNQSVAKKIYNWVIDKLNKFTGGKNEKIFWEDIKNKFETAYNQEFNKNDINTYKQYSIQTDNNGNHYVKVDTDQNIFDGIDKKDYNKVAKMYIQDYLMGKTKLSDNDTAVIDRKSANKYTNPGKKQQNFDKKMQLTPELKNVLEIAQKDSISLPIKSNSKYQNWEYYKFDFELSGKKFNGTVNIGIDSNGNKHFYEINKIKEVDDISGTSLNRSSTSLSNNSLPLPQKNVNSQPLQKYSMQESENNSGSFNLQENKQKQLEIIQKNNKMQDDYHTGIRTVEDIKTLEETLQDSDWSGYDEFNPDYTRNMANEALKTGKITVYSSYPIKQGTFVSPSKMEAESYSGNGKVYSKEININDVAWIDPTQGQYANINQKYALPTKEWQQFLEDNYQKQGTGKKLKEYNLPTEEDVKTKLNLPTKENINTQGEMINWNDIERPEGKIRNTKGTLNPKEISNMDVEDSNTTPILPNRNYKKGNKESSFFSNVVTDAKFLNKDLRQEMAHDENIRYYKGITNEETLEKAYKSLQNGGKKETLQWFNKDTKNVSAEDVAKGWILLKQYQDSGDYQGAVEVAKKMRDMATGAGQTVQAYNILSRLTPEGMFYYAQSELSEAYNKMVEGKSQKWIEENRDKFDLTPEETKFIMDNMRQVAKMEDGYDKKVKIAEIQKIVSDKIPPTVGQSVKSWMRISMLFNPKTQVRNVTGNAVILPVNIGSDFISSGIDKVISKKTGVRTTGNINLKNYTKGFGKGLYESYNDFRKGINTRNIEGNRFEVSEGKNFKNKGIGKALNRVDSLLSFMLDAGDRGFYEATFTNSINNQLILNNTTEVTQEMIDIATNEALQRTWQDNNKYTEAVLKVRNILNYANIKGYGLGDILIPFAKTPANLTKAIVDYSPVGLVKTITLDARTFKNSLQNGQFTPQMQHKFVQNIGKGMAGSFLYVLGYALAKVGIASGEANDDKDVKNFMKNSLGISSYSIKIGDKTFTYDWAQPVATPLAIMTNYVKYSEEKQDANIIEKGIKSLNIGTEQLLQQSFMESLNTVLNGNGTTLENLSQAILELPARAIPTFSKQIADMVDGTQRTSFEYGKPVKSAVNSVISKIPIASKKLPVARDTLGNEIKKYGGENNLWNVMFNPANVNKGELSKAGEEIYRLYEETGETTIFPITAPYYINSKGEKITMTSEQRSEYQKVTGEYTEKAIEELLSNSSYMELSDEKKNELITDIISDSNAKAKHDILNVETEDAKKKRELIENVTTKNYYDYRLKTKDITGEGANKRKIGVLANSDYSDKTKEIIYKNTEGSNDKKIIVVDKLGLPINEYLKYKSQKFESDKDEDGETIFGTKKQKVYDYLNNISDKDLSEDYKKIILKIEDINDYDNDIVNFVNNSKQLNYDERTEILKDLGFKTDKDGKIQTKSIIPIYKYVK